MSPCAQTVTFPLRRSLRRGRDGDARESRTLLVLQKRQQVVFAFVLDSGLYLVRRVSGLLVVAMLIHGLWDFSTFIGAGRGEDTGAIPDTIAAAPFAWGTMLVTIAALVVLFRRGKPAVAPAT